VTYGVDYAWGRPGVAALRAAGAKFVCRYFSHDTTGKNLTPSEARELSDGGLWLVGIWESTADRASGGYGAGREDAKAALAQAQACGMPPDRPVYFAVDFDASPDQMGTINAYLDGAASVLGKDRVGVYGGYYVVKAALGGGHCVWAWQASAWSGGQWDDRAQIRQTSIDRYIGGVDCDDNTATTTDYGQWMVGRSPHQQNQQEDDMLYGQLDNGPGAVTPISMPQGSARAIGFTGDNGLQGLKPAVLRVAVHDKSGWHVTEGVVVDASKAKAVVTFRDPASTDGVSVRREDKGDVRIAWDAS
jgi:hypothetical protein